MQRTFEIYVKPSTNPVAVKRGFSWPGFLFHWIWALAKGLWVIGGILLVADILEAVARFTFLPEQLVFIAIIRFAIALYVGFKGNSWRAAKLERQGYSLDCVIPAESVARALSLYAVRGKEGHVKNTHAPSFFSTPKYLQKIFAITGLTWKAALRFKLFLVIAVLLIAAVVALPLIIQDDGTARGFTQIILTYTLSAITALLGLSTLWLSCGTLARDIEECQIQVVATKPIARWQIWLGKWLGIVTLNAVLLAISGACVYGLLQYRAGKLPAEEQKVLREQILVARGSAKEFNDPKEIERETERILQGRLKSNPVDNQADIPEVRRQIREGVKADLQLVPPGYVRQWKIDLSSVKNELPGRPLQLRIKFNSADKSPSGTFNLRWEAGNPESTNYWQSDLMSLAPDTFHEFTIPSDLADDKGILTIMVMNPTPTSLLFPLDDGMEVLYPQGSFAMNFTRGLGIIFCWMALMAALGLMAASFLSFPVATFFSLALLMVVLSGGTLTDSIESGSVAAGNEETGQAGHSAMDIVLIPTFKGIVAIISLVRNYSPIDSLSTGRNISWTELGTAFAQLVLLLGGILAVAGMVFFNRRELATAQGTQ